MHQQTILATLPGHAPRERLQVVLRQQPTGRLLVELREQHFGEGIGWFDQRTLALDPRQWQQLRAVLGDHGPAEVLGEAAAEVPATIPFPGPATAPAFRSAVDAG